MKRLGWPEIRAGLIALAIVIGLVEGCPLPARGYEADWQRGYVDILRPAQETVLTPVAGIFRVLQFSQRWALFQAAGRERFRLVVEAHTGDSWKLLYRAGDSDYREYADVLESRRIQGIWIPTDRIAARYPAFAEWLAGRIMAEHPEYVAIRLRQEKIVLRAGEITGTGEFTFTHVRPRVRR